MFGFYAMLAVLVLIAAALNYGAVDAAGFWGSLAMTGMFAAVATAAANAC
jgi:hypothetical protein